MNNVIRFPGGWRRKDGVWHGGQRYPDVDALRDALTDREWARMEEWERRRWAWRERVAGSACSGGGNAA